ncbi:MAG: helix-turn-helix domain-containing protein [Acidobacteriota bacterium]
MAVAPTRSILVVTTDRSLVQAVERVAAEARVTATSCLRSFKRLIRPAVLLLDPRAVGVCCLERLRALSRHPLPEEVLFLALTARQEVLLRLPTACPGKVVHPDQLASILRSARPETPSRRAWDHRRSIFAPERHAGSALRFLTTASEHRHRRLTVAAAAAATQTSVRTLGRLCRRAFGVSPYTILSLARIWSVAESLRRQGASLESVAEAHGFPDVSTMSRVFLRFTGVRPGAYRQRVARSVSRSAQAMSGRGMDPGRPFG